MTPAPMRISASETTISFIRWPMKTPGLIGRRNFVTQRPTSVAPATRIAPGFSTSVAARSSTFVGTMARSSPRLHVAALSSQFGKAGPDGLPFDVQGVQRLPAGLRGRQRGLDDGLIARAAAEIALQRRLDVHHRRIGIGHPQSVQRHDEPRSAEAALAAVAFDHGLLDGMQRAAGTRQMLHRHHMAAVAGCEKPDAGVDRLIDQFAIAEAPDQDRACAAIALGAALLGPGQAALEAEIVEQRVARADLAQARLAAVQKEADLPAHCISPCQRR